MDPVKKTIQDRDIERIMGNLLRYGVIASATLIIFGAILYLFQHGQDIPAYSKFTGEPKTITDFHLLWATALKGRGRSIIQLGLFLLIATPIARIVFSIIGYIIEKDYLYLLITAIVLGLILYSFL